MEHKEFVWGGLPNDSFEGTVQTQVGFSGSAGGQMGGQWHHTSRGIHILYGKGNENHELGTGFFVSAVKGVEFVSDRMSYIL
jgi:hypothetical protein